MADSSDLVPVLYHAIPSFYSQISRLALTERGIRYKNCPVNLLTGESRTERYIREVNPLGTVPTLKHEGASFTDSKEIVEYADSLPSARPRLCPQGDSEKDRRIRHFWDSFRKLNMVVITYGAMYHRDLTVDCIPPEMLMGKRQLYNHLTNSEEEAAAIRRDHPDLRAGMEGRRDFFAIRDMVVDQATVLGHWKECDDLLGEVEDQLEQHHEKYGNHSSVEYWLCGKDFSVADVYLACLLHRLTFVGLAERLFLAKRPYTTEYYRRVLKRKSFVREVAYVNNILWSYVLPTLQAWVRRARPYLLAGFVVGVGVYAYWQADELKTAATHVWEWFQR